MSHSEPSYISRAPVSLLYLNSPVLGDPSRCDVLPTGITNPEVPDITSFPVSASNVISSPAVVDVIVAEIKIR